MGESVYYIYGHRCVRHTHTHTHTQRERERERGRASLRIDQTPPTLPNLWLRLGLTTQPAAEDTDGRCSSAPTTAGPPPRSGYERQLCLVRFVGQVKNNSTEELTNLGSSGRWWLRWSRGAPFIISSTTNSSMIPGSLMRLVAARAFRLLTLSRNSTLK